jgi:serine/threonine protein kinase
MDEGEILQQIQSLVSPDEWQSAQTLVGANASSTTIVQCLVQAGALTDFQAEGIKRGAFVGLRIGNYDILDRLGSGGMGTVFKARHRRMRRVVALKVLARQHCEDPMFVNRFQREVQTLAQLTHPNIVAAYDADEAEVGHFLVMEFVDGADLSTIVARRRMTLRDAVRAICDTARGLDYAHKRGIIHRDIKPANLLQDASTGVVKVTDLGLARPAELSAANSGITQAGGIIGTADYMSPEQAVDSTNLGPATDIYSLGGTLYFVLTGKAPYRANTLMNTLLLHRDGPIPDVRADRPEVPVRLAELTRRMLGKTPADRPDSMEKVVAELEAIDSELGDEVMETEFGATSVFSDKFTGLDALDSSSSSKPISVIVVEPSRTQAKIIRRCLEATDTATVEMFATGAEALANLRTRRADVVVSAMHLKDVTGVRLAQDVRAILGPPAESKAPGFVLITSASEGPEAAGLSSAGLAISLHKPFTPEQLIQALSLAIGFPLPVRPLDESFAGSFVGASTMGKPPSSVVGKASFENKKVLLVDDSSAALIYERKILEEIGFKSFVEALDGARAVAAAAVQPFDLIITDYNMPIMDGAALVGYLRENPATAKIPIVMVTTETSAEKLDPIRRLDVAGIIEKSFAIDVVRNVVEKLW